MKAEESEIEILVEGEGLTEIEAIRIPRGSSASAIIVAVATKGAFPAEEAILFLEDSDVPVHPMVLIIEEEVSGKVHHVHRAHKIEVGVYYQARKISRHFSPSMRVQRILDWAVGPDGFKIDPTIAPEMELALHGQTAPLPKVAHIGRYIHHPHCELDFDLIRGVVPNGAPSC
jgi:hypothetical protein